MFFFSFLSFFFFLLYFFFFNDTATTEIYTLSLHDALPIYFVWGLRKAAKRRPHGGHSHLTEDGNVNYTPWILFTIFVLGPCEPLIPLLMYPAAKASTAGIALVVLIFLVVTVVTMLGTVMLLSTGIERLPIKRLERYTHALAGATISLCGVAIQFLGL